nr:MAG TPA: hypothetical protein [Caudoviricetes sp.]
MLSHPDSPARFTVISKSFRRRFSDSNCRIVSFSSRLVWNIFSPPQWL